MRKCTESANTYTTPRRLPNGGGDGALATTSFHVQFLQTSLSSRGIMFITPRVRAYVGNLVCLLLRHLGDREMLTSSHPGGQPARNESGHRPWIRLAHVRSYAQTCFGVLSHGEGSSCTLCLHLHRALCRFTYQPMPRVTAISLHCRLPKALCRASLPSTPTPNSPSYRLDTLLP